MRTTEHATVALGHQCTDFIDLHRGILGSVAKSEPRRAVDELLADIEFREYLRAKLNDDQSLWRHTAANAYLLSAVVTRRRERRALRARLDRTNSADVARLRVALCTLDALVRPKLATHAFTSAQWNAVRAGRAIVIPSRRAA